MPKSISFYVIAVIPLFWGEEFGELPNSKQSAFSSIFIE